MDVINIAGFIQLVIAAIGLIGLAIVVTILAKSLKGDVNKVGRIVICVLLALTVAGLFVGGAWRALSGDLTGLVFGS